MFLPFYLSGRDGTKAPFLRLTMLAKVPGLFRSSSYVTCVKFSWFKIGGDKKRLNRHDRNTYLGNSFITSLQRIRNYTENTPSRLNTDFLKVIKGQLAMYFQMQKGEFPTSLMGFELALHTHHKGVKQCFCQVLANIPGHLVPPKNCFSKCSAWGLSPAL